MITNILILDTETTGLVAGKDKLIEVAGVLYNIQHKAILQIYSTLFPCDKNEAQHINNIDPVITQSGYSTELAEKVLIDMASSAHAIVAHNAIFDMKFVAKWSPVLGSMKWICTKNDFDWGVQLYRKRLEDICIAFGVPYTGAHRALSDCFLMKKCFDKVPDLERRFNSPFGKNPSERFI